MMLAALEVGVEWCTMVEVERKSMTSSGAALPSAFSIPSACVAVCCSVLRCVAVCCSVLPCVLQRVAVCRMNRKTMTSSGAAF